jgi:hypothetical protein
LRIRHDLLLVFLCHARGSSILIYHFCCFLLCLFQCCNLSSLHLLILLSGLKSQTMEMMYLLIAKALRETGLDKEYHPTDYLSFFCLGNREEKGDDTNEAPASTPVDEGTIQVRH